MDSITWPMGITKVKRYKDKAQVIPPSQNTLWNWVMKMGCWVLSAHPRLQHLHPWAPSKHRRVVQLQKLGTCSRNQCMVDCGTENVTIVFGFKSLSLTLIKYSASQSLGVIVCKVIWEKYVCLQEGSSRWTVAGWRARPSGIPLVTSVYWAHSNHLDYRKEHTSSEE